MMNAKQVLSGRKRMPYKSKKQTKAYYATKGWKKPVKKKKGYKK